MAKVKDPAELNVEDKLKNLYQLQSLMTEIDQIKTLRGELPLEVKDLEDEIAGLETRIEKINDDIASAKKEINERQGVIEKNKMDIERFENQMKNVRNNREYENFSKQIEYLRLDNELNQKRIGEAKASLETRGDELLKSNQVLGFHLYTCQFGVYEDTAAVLAHYDLLAGADVQLALGRNLVEAATACVALNVNHGQAVA